jgi:hypothetical protein
MNLQLLHIVTHTVTHLPPTKEAQVLSQASLYGICGEQSGTGISFLSAFHFSLVSIAPPMFHILVISHQHHIILANDSIIKQHIEK